MGLIQIDPDTGPDRWCKMRPIKPGGFLGSETSLDNGVTISDAVLICFTQICAFFCCQLRQKSREENDDVINIFHAVTEP